MIQHLSQIDGNTDETGMRTGETGNRGTPVVAMTETETDESQVGEMERKKYAIDTTGTKGTGNGAETASVSHRGKARGTFGRILNPERQESRRNHKVCPWVSFLMLTLCLNTPLAQPSAPASQKVSPTRSDEEGEAEEGEAMETLNADDEAMMAMMGMIGFGSTKVTFLKFSHPFPL